MSAGGLDLDAKLASHPDELEGLSIIEGIEGVDADASMDYRPIARSSFCSGNRLLCSMVVLFLMTMISCGLSIYAIVTVRTMTTSHPLSTSRTATYVACACNTSTTVTYVAADTSTTAISAMPIAADTSTTTMYVAGDYKISARDESHGNWLLCNGSYFDPAKFPDLYQVIGFAFGQQEGEGFRPNDRGTYDKVVLFRVPNVLDRVLGMSGGHGMGTLTGAETIVLDVSNIPTHSHYIAKKLNEHTGPTSPTANQGPYLSSHGGYFAPDYSSEYILSETEEKPDNFSSSSVGGGAAFSVYQPTAFIGNLFIYTGGS